MEQFFHFVINHWSLWLLFLLVLVTIFFLETKGQWYGVKLITTQQLTDLINNQQGTVVDIRDKPAFAAGHIIGAINIPENEFAEKIKKLYQYRSKPVIIVCADGQQSSKVGDQLQADRFEQVFRLRGGVKGWQNEELPLEL